MNQSIKISKKLRTRKLLPKLFRIIEEQGYLPAEVSSSYPQRKHGVWIWSEKAPRDVIDELKINGNFLDKCIIHIFNSRYCPPLKLKKFTKPSFKDYRIYPRGMYNNRVGIIDMSIRNPWIAPSTGGKYGALIGSLDYDIDEPTIKGQVYGEKSMSKIKRISKIIENQLEKKVDLILAESNELPTEIYPEPISGI